MEWLNNKAEDYIKEDSNGKAPPITKEQARIILSQLENNVCKIYTKNYGNGTGFFCKIPYPNQFILFPALITNNHVLNGEDLKINKTVKLSLDDDSIIKYILLDKSRKIFTNQELDVSIIEIKPEFEGINNYLDIDDNIYLENYSDIYKNKSIYILQYPKGEKCSFKVDLIKEIKDKTIRHLIVLNLIFRVPNFINL